MSDRCYLIIYESSIWRIRIFTPNSTPVMANQLWKHNLTETNSVGSYREITVYTKPVAGIRDPAAAVTTRVHQALKIGNYFHELSKHYNLSYPFPWEYKITRGEEWQNIAREPFFVGLTDMTDEEIAAEGEPYIFRCHFYAKFGVARAANSRFRPILQSE